MSRDYDPLDLPGQERSKEEIERREKLARGNEAEDFKKVMSQKWGRRFVWRQLEVAGVFRTSFTGNSQTFFNEGMRNSGLRLMALINAECPEQYVVMLNENVERPDKDKSK